MYSSNQNQSIIAQSCNLDTSQHNTMKNKRESLDICSPILSPRNNSIEKFKNNNNINSLCKQKSETINSFNKRKGENLCENDETEKRLKTDQIEIQRNFEPFSLLINCVFLRRQGL